MTNKERTLVIEQAMILVAEARELVSEAVEGTSVQNNYEAYGEYGFQRLMGEGNPHDDSLEDLMKEF